MGLSKAFQSHGEFCASHPWEVIIGTIALLTSVVSMSAISSVDKVCGWNGKCQTMQDVQSSDVLILTITRCIAVIYIYLQFRNLRKMGSKYLLGITGIFTIFSSFVFSIAVVNLAGGDLTGLNEALPFFLLLVDLTKACALAKFVLSSKDQNELVDNIGQGMSVLGPAITLDTLVETLVIGIGTLSGVRTLETMCCFGCLTVVANFLAFMTFYPACLALMFELLKGNSSYGPVKQLQQITVLLGDSHKEEDDNPVRQRVKLIMSAGLMVFHTMSRMVADGEDMDTELSSGVSTQHGGSTLDEEATLWQYFLFKTFGTDMEYTIPAVLSLFLSIKYIFFDDATDKKVLQKIDLSPKYMDDRNESSIQERSCRKLITDREIQQSPMELLQSHTEKTHEVEQTSDSTETRESSENSPKGSPRKKSVTFCVGSDSEEDEDQSKVTSNTEHRVDLVESVGTQTEDIEEKSDQGVPSAEPRSLKECVEIMKSDEGPAALTNTEIMQLVKAKHIPAYKLEAILGDHERGVLVRRSLVSESLTSSEPLYSLPYQSYDYKYVEGACCENVIGYMPVPVGVAGPLLLDGQQYHIPMATTEGCLVASTNRGCRALSVSGGARSCVLGDSMTRAPVVRFCNAARASQCKMWIEDAVNFSTLKEAFDSTSRFGKLQRIHVVQAARNLYIRFVGRTGDAMGMNMVSKGSEKALRVLQETFSDIEILSLSGNFCTDKKPSAVNWLEGRGKSVVCEAVIPADVVKTTLKTTVHALVDLNISKNLMGSAMAGSIGGFNAHAANIVTAIFIATGQDPAQNVCSSNCLTVMEATGCDGEDLYISCTMPSIEVGTVGGGTNLPPQAACLQMLGIKGSNPENPGENATRLAQVVCGAVLAGELSLMSALAAGHLVRSHLRHNRSSLNMGENRPNVKSATTEVSNTRCAEKLS